MALDVKECVEVDSKYSFVVRPSTTPTECARAPWADSETSRAESTRRM
jgi:hypothetical protein